MKLKKSRKSYLPDELIAEIVRKLPMKYILQFMSVNKSWHSFISSSSFIKSSISNSNNNNRYLLWTHSDKYILEDSSGGVEDKFNRLIHYTPGYWSCARNRKVKVYGICNGLICVSDSNLEVTSRIFLWNPIIRRGKEISMIRHADDEVDDEHDADCDLCFGYFHDDYKVIRIACYDGGKYGVGVYSLSTDAWKVIYCQGDSLAHSLICNPSSNKFVDGVAYFGVAHRATSTCKLLCFDLHHKKIREVQFPDKFGSQLYQDSRNPKYPFSVEHCGDSIALIQIMEGQLTRWVLRKCATTNTNTSIWDNVVTVDLETHACIHPLGMAEHGKYLLRDYVGGKYWWDLGRSQIEECTSDTETNDLWAWAVDYLLGNLVLLDEEELLHSSSFRYIF